MAKRKYRTGKPKMFFDHLYGNWMAKPKDPRRTKKYANRKMGIRGAFGNMRTRKAKVGQ